MIGPEGAGWFKQPLTSLEDIDGLRIRFAGLGGQVMERLGASITMLPAGELYQALERSTIDATEISQPAIDRILGLQRVTEEVLQEKAVEDAMFRRVLESQRAFMRNHQVWHEKGYSPRNFDRPD